MIKNKQEKIINEALKQCKKAFAFSLLFSFFISILTLASSIYSLQVLDRVLSSSSIETLIFLTIIVVVFLIFLGILTAIRANVLLQVSNWLDEKLSPILFNNTLEEGVLDKNGNSQNMKDLQTIKSFISGQSLAVLLDAPFALVYLAVIFFIHPINGFIVLIGGFIMLKMAYFNEKSTKDLIEKTNKMQMEVLQDFEIISSNSEVVNAMAMKDNVRKNWQINNDKLRQLNNLLTCKINNISATNKSIRIAIQTATMAAGAVLVIYNKMSAGGIIATSILAGKALAPFDSAISLWKILKTAKFSYERLNKSLENYVEDKNKITLPSLKGEISIEKLIYKEKKSDQIVIKGISLKILEGELLAIIGPTGGGKTTLARLLIGVLNPTSGMIRLDNANIFNQDLDKIGKFIGYLPQDVELFKGSVKDNIARMQRDARDEDIIKAAKFCDVHDLILRLPQGYETMIEKNAANLSAGQRQRIALARAYFGDVKFVVLDEPNSNLDSDGEEALNKTLKRAKENKITTVIITHRVAVAKICNRVVVLNNGELKPLNEVSKAIEQGVASGK